MVSVNTTMQIDLMGQCASEAIGTIQLSGTGGQVDTAVGARECADGKSIIALKSMVMVRDEDGEKRVPKSTIVPVHPEGVVITLTRAAVDYVVTEYGVAALRGMSVRERVHALAGIAHPSVRDYLLEEASRWRLA
jgi:acyl-CoA hydrolase